MTRKDFQVVAEATAELVVHCFPIPEDQLARVSALEEAGNRVANYLERTNPAFNRRRFIDAVQTAGR